MFQIFSRNLKEASVLIIILAITKQLAYYNRFDVPISYFFGFSEIWLFLSDDMFYLISFISFSLWGYEKIKKGELSNTQQETPKNTFVEKIVYVTMLVILIVLIITAIVRMFYVNDYSIKINMIANVIILVAFIYIIYFNRSSNSYMSDGFIFLCLALVLVLLLIKINTKIRSVENGKYNGTYIVTVDTTYRSNDSTYFIGKTEKFVFQYNKFDSSTSIIPVESIKKMVIKSK